MAWYSRRGKNSRKRRMIVRTEGLLWVTGGLGAWTVIRPWPDMQSNILRRCVLGRKT